MEFDDAGGAGCSTCSGAGGAGQPSRVIYPTFAKVYSYDVRGRKVGETDILSAAESYYTGFGYDAAGNGQTGCAGKLASCDDSGHRATDHRRG